MPQPQPPPSPPSQFPQGFIPLYLGSRPHHLIFRRVAPHTDNYIDCYCGAHLGHLPPTLGPAPALALFTYHLRQLGLTPETNTFNKNGNGNRT